MSRRTQAASAMSDRSKAKAVTRTDRRRVRTRTALLQAGRRLFAVRDVDGVSVDEIVAAADVAKGSFYNHFADKDGFAREIGSAVRRQAELAVTQANESVTDPAVSVARALCVFIRFAVEHRDSAQVLWKLHSGATMIDAPINRGLRDLVQRGIDSRRFRHIDLESGVVLIMGIVVISLRHALEERMPTAPFSIARSMAAGLLRALGIPPAQSVRLATAAAQEIIGDSRSEHSTV